MSKAGYRRLIDIADRDLGAEPVQPGRRRQTDASCPACDDDDFARHRTAGLVVASAKLMPGPVAEFVGRRFGMEHAFLDDVDQEARKAYENRARGVDT